MRDRLRDASNPPGERDDPRLARYARDLEVTARKLLSDDTSLADLKLAAAALKEMRRAFRRLAPYRHQPKVATFGSARVRPSDPTFAVAEEFARRIAAAGYMVISGAGPGIMEACQRGAGRERSFGFNIRLPMEQAPNEVIDGDPKLLTFRYFFVRKLFFVKEANAVALFPGGFGTQDEAFEILTLLQTGKCQPMPFVLIDEPRGTYWKAWDDWVRQQMLRRHLISPTDTSLYRITGSPAEAVEEIRRFYRLYHSCRYVRDLLVIRIRRRLPDRSIRQLTEEFGDILRGGKIEQREALPAERDSPEIQDLPRLVLAFDRASFGRLRQLIDRINEIGAPLILDPGEKS